MFGSQNEDQLTEAPCSEAFGLKTLYQPYPEDRQEKNLPRGSSTSYQKRSFPQLTSSQFIAAI
ncbi:unnamed protein product [Phytomonas sp. EM1]|nr:unnamed protein product [Phytomonas sp. EM1]|eukprot:CCW59871.1 unnamed protein product [Phytomonas sp. isolate EM1]